MPHVDELVHDQHDPILVVSLASGALAASDRDYSTAQSLVASCTDCARIHDDVLAIATATKALPPAIRTRDFRISQEQAARLRPAGWRRLLGGFASGPLFSRQLGVGLATLGVAGLLLTALPGIPLGGMAAGGAAAPSAAAPAPAYESLQSDGTGTLSRPAASGAAASEAPGEAGPDALGAPGTFQPGSTDTAYGLSGATAKPLADENTTTVAGGPRAPSASAEPVRQAPESQISDAPSSNEPSLLAIVSAVLLASGILLLIARRLGRRTLSV